MKCYILGICFALSCFFQLCSEEVDVTQPLRIQQLMPPDKLLFGIGIEPALPRDFVAMTPKGELNYSDWVYWGPEAVLKSFFKRQGSLSQPIIRVRISPNSDQSYLDLFDEEKEKKLYAENEMTLLSTTKGQWGKYPYRTLTARYKKETIYNAWVGLNLPNGILLHFNLVCPNKKKKQTENNEIDLWERFFSETKELPEPLFFKAHGQEMHPGFTIMNLIGLRAKVTAEKRKSDGKIQFAVIPLDLGITFTYDRALECGMGADWHHGEPLLKISGTFKAVGTYFVDSYSTVSVLIKEVEEFSNLPLLKKGVFINEM